CVFREALGQFYRQHCAERAEFRALVGRRNQTASIWRQIRRNRRHIVDGRLEIKSGFYKIVNRRYERRHVWAVDASSKPDPELFLVYEGEACKASVRTDERGTYTRYSGLGTILARTSPRGRWFDTHATALDHERDDWEGYTDEWSGDRRPIV